MPPLDSEKTLHDLSSDSKKSVETQAKTDEKENYKDGQVLLNNRQNKKPTAEKHTVIPSQDDESVDKKDEQLDKDTDPENDRFLST